MEFKPKKVACSKKHKDFFPVLGLEINDKNGVEYHDGDIVICHFKISEMRYPMKGFIRYFGGRFEIVCPWKKGDGFERYVMGLNSDHEIVGHIYKDEHLIVEQMTIPFTRTGGIRE